MRVFTNYKPWFFVFLFSTLMPIAAYSLHSLESNHSLKSVYPKFQLSQNTFIFNPSTLTWKAINENGHVVKTGRGSGGRRYCPDIHRSCKTPSGTYTVVSKGGASCRSSRYPVGRGGAPMPYCMFFSRFYAIHGSPDVPNYNASHGCVRVRPYDARWLYHHFIKIGTRVIIKSY